MENKVCYICLKKITNDDYFHLGKNLNGIKLDKHTKCKSTHLSLEKLKEIKNWTEYPKAKGKKK